MLRALKLAVLIASIFVPPCQMHRPMLRALKPTVLDTHGVVGMSDASPDVEGIETLSRLDELVEKVRSDASPDVEGIETWTSARLERSSVVRCIARC